MYINFNNNIADSYISCLFVQIVLVEFSIIWKLPPSQTYSIEIQHNLCENLNINYMNFQAPSLSQQIDWKVFKKYSLKDSYHRNQIYLSSTAFHSLRKPHWPCQKWKGTATKSKLSPNNHLKIADRTRYQ